jgi:hypothetical protein
MPVTKLFTHTSQLKNSRISIIDVNLILTKRNLIAKNRNYTAFKVL